MCVNLQYILELPSVLTEKIKDYIPYEYLVVLNKEYYNLYNARSRKFIPAAYFNSYIRDVVRKDNSFIFDYVLKEYSTTWENRKKYHYNKESFSSYKDFLKQYSLDKDSYKCNNILRNDDGKNNTSIKQHKKVHSKNYKWKL